MFTGTHQGCPAFLSQDDFVAVIGAEVDLTTICRTINPDEFREEIPVKNSLAGFAKEGAGQVR